MNQADYTNVIPLHSNAKTVLDMTQDERSRIDKAIGGKLNQLCITDWTYLKKKGISCEKIACALRTILDICGRKTWEQGNHDPKMIFEKFKVENIGLPLIITTDLFDDTLVSHHIFQITNIHNQQFLKVSRGAIRQILNNGFFGPLSADRISPEKIISVLELKPGNSELVLKTTLVYSSSTSFYTQETWEKVNSAPGVRVPIDESAEAYIQGADSSAGEELCYIFNRSQRNAPITHVHHCELESPIRNSGMHIYNFQSKKVFVPQVTNDPLDSFSKLNFSEKMTDA